MRDRCDSHPDHWPSQEPEKPGKAAKDVKTQDEGKEKPKMEKDAKPKEIQKSGGEENAKEDVKLAEVDKETKEMQEKDERSIQWE